MWSTVGEGDDVDVSWDPADSVLLGGEPVATPSGASKSAPVIASA